MKLPVNSVRIHRFRGVPSDLVVDFRAHDGNAASAIVSGDNGTGKSSIVDALEFALQARVNRSQKFHSGSGPSALSLAGIGNPSVEVALSDGTIVSREMTLNLEQKLV